MKTPALWWFADTKLQAAMDLGIHVIVIDRPRLNLKVTWYHQMMNSFKLWEDTNGLR